MILEHTRSSLKSTKSLLKDISSNKYEQQRSCHKKNCYFTCLVKIICMPASQTIRLFNMMTSGLQIICFDLVCNLRTLKLLQYHASTFKSSQKLLIFVFHEIVIFSTQIAYCDSRQLNSNSVHVVSYTTFVKRL